MNFITKTLAGVTALSSIMMPVSASTFEEHTELARAVASTGVKVLINPPICQQRDAYGWYHARKSMLVVCQENATAFHYSYSEMVAWTAEDLDTLRHEAHHLVQDCMDNVLNGKLETVYVEPAEMIGSVLSKEQIESVLNAYDDATNNRKVLELEASSVARLNNPLEQVADIKKYCF